MLSNLILFFFQTGYIYKSFISQFKKIILQNPYSLSMQKWKQLILVRKRKFSQSSNTIYFDHTLTKSEAGLEMKHTEA